MLSTKERRLLEKPMIEVLSGLSFLFLSMILLLNPLPGIELIAQGQNPSAMDSKTDQAALRQLINANRALLYTFAKEYLKLRKEPLPARLVHLKRIASPLEKAAETLETFLKSHPLIDAGEARSQLDTLRAYAEFAGKDVATRSIFLSDEVTNRARILHKEEPLPVFGAGGKVVLLSVLGADNTVNHIIVAHSVRNDMDEQAIEAARAFTFVSASKDGHPVSQLVEIEYKFTSSGV